MKSNIRQNKTHYDVLIISSLVFALIIVSILVTSLAFYSANKQKSGIIKLGELDFCVYSTGEGKNNIVPGDLVNTQMVLTNARDVSGTNNDGLCSILIKYTMQNNTLEPFFLDSSQWIQDNNEYYFCDVINPGENINLFDKIRFLESNGNQWQGKNIDIVIRVDALQAENQAYKEVWADAPQSWIDKIDEILL